MIFAKAVGVHFTILGSFIFSASDALKLKGCISKEEQASSSKASKADEIDSATLTASVGVFLSTERVDAVADGDPNPLPCCSHFSS